MITDNIYGGGSLGPDRRVALVTGATRGLGKAMAEELLGSGFAVAFCGRAEDAVKNLASQLSATGPVMGLAGDLSSEPFADRLIDAVASRWGRLDILINNASTLGAVPLPSMRNFSRQNFLSVWTVNVLAPLDLVSRALPYLDAVGGMSLAISSDAATGGYGGWAAYGGAKAAVDLAYATLANEEPHLRFYSLDPGDMDTDMHRQAVLADTSRLRQPQEVARALAPLFRREARYPTGSRLRLADTASGLVLEVTA